jgi:hypothetical protein
MIKDIVLKNIPCLFYSEIKYAKYANIIGWNITILDKTYRMMVSSNQLELEDAQENACQQYIKENGFKLSWLLNYLNLYWDVVEFDDNGYIRLIKYIDNGIHEDLHGDIFLNPLQFRIGITQSNDRLLSALHANGIEIVNDKNG